MTDGILADLFHACSFAAYLQQAQKAANADRTVFIPRF